MSKEAERIQTTASVDALISQRCEGLLRTAHDSMRAAALRLSAELLVILTDASVWSTRKVDVPKRWASVTGGLYKASREFLGEVDGKRVYDQVQYWTRKAHAEPTILTNIVPSGFDLETLTEVMDAHGFRLPPSAQAKETPEQKKAREAEEKKAGTEAVTIRKPLQTPLLTLVTSIGSISAALYARLEAGETFDQATRESFQRVLDRMMKIDDRIEQQAPAPVAVAS